MQFKAYEITNDRFLQRIEADSISPQWLTDQTQRWIDMTEFETRDLEELLEPLDLHEDIIDACLIPQSRPLVINLEEILFVSIPVQTDKNNLSYLTILCGPTTLITIQHSDIHYMDNLASWYFRDRRLIVANTAGLLFELVSTSLRKMVPAFFSLRDEVEAMSQLLEKDTGAIDVDGIMILAREAAQMDILFQDQVYSLSELLAGHSESLALKSIRTDFADQVADLDRARSGIHRLQDRIRDLHQYHLHHVEEATNRRLNMVAMLSAIYLPPTLIAGIYGMNFENIPIIGMRFGYSVIMASMIALVVGQLVFFYHRGWFK